MIEHLHASDVQLTTKLFYFYNSRVTSCIIINRPMPRLPIHVVTTISYPLHITHTIQVPIIIKIYLCLSRSERELKLRYYSRKD